MKKLMPTIFVGHGNPMNAITENRFTEGWSIIGKTIPRPKAILSISAHYYIPFCMVTISPKPATIHDFSGFPPELFQIEYPAPGSPELARRVKEILNPNLVKDDDYWGLDHGTWSVLKHMFPHADIPVVQLSIDEKQSALFHYELGKQLGLLREEGVLIIGSGNVVHNLRLYGWQNRDVPPFDWAVKFENSLREMTLKGEYKPLIDYINMGPDAELAIPVPDHYLPFIYVLGLSREGEKVSFPVEGFDGGTVSMLAVQFG